MTSKAQLQANAKYHEKFDDIKIRVPKGNREKFKEFAESKGKSLNALIIELLENDMNSSQSETQSAGADTLEVSEAVTEREECENISKYKDETWSDFIFKCSECNAQFDIDKSIEEEPVKVNFCPKCGRRIKT